MASEIKANKISPATDTDFTFGDSGDTFTVPSGATIVNSGIATGFGVILQVKHVIKTDVWSNTTADTFIDIPDLTLTTDTLATTSSRVMVTACISLSHASETAGWKITDGSGDLITDFVGDAWGDRARVTGGSNHVTHFMMRHTESVTVIHTPGVTTAQTYKIMTYKDKASGTAYLNRSAYDVNTNGVAVGVSSLTVQEIGA